MDDLHSPTVASGTTSHQTSNGVTKGDSLEQLISKKEKIEQELTALGTVLDSHGVNMNTTLTTFDGYPRADLDIAQIRMTRTNIIRLKNDHKSLLAEMEKAIHQRFAEGKSASAESQSQSQLRSQPHIAGTAPSAESEGISSTRNVVIEPPFAKVNTVTPNSPASLAGLMAGDKVTNFGNVDWTNHERLTKLAQTVQENENRVITVKVLREIDTDSPSQTISLSLTPTRNWGGRGLLGCHILPL